MFEYRELILGLQLSNNIFLLVYLRRFRTCLKMADSSDANLVGNLFFNVVKTKCFVLKPEKYCKQYNFQKKKCERKGLRKRAHMRDNREF